MQKLLWTMTLVAGAALVGCGKKEEAAPAAPAAAAPAEAAMPELKVAIDASYEPFTYKTPDGKPTGFDVDIAEALCAEIKRKCVYVEQVWDSMIPGLLAQKYDVIISSMSITEERLQQVDFSDKYYNTPSRIVVKADTAFTDLPLSRARTLACSRAAPKKNLPWES